MFLLDGWGGYFQAGMRYMYMYICSYYTLFAIQLCASHVPNHRVFRGALCCNVYFSFGLDTWYLMGTWSIRADIGLKNHD